MKKRKTFAAIALAVALFSPMSVMTACDSEAPPLADAPIESETPELPAPPESETPEPPTPPETGNLGNGDNDLDNDAPVVLPTAQKAEYIKCTGTSVNLRAGAGTSFAAVGAAKKGEIYAVLGKIGSWYQTYHRGKTVYLSAGYAALFSMEKSEDEQVENVLKEGYRQLGVPYVYGAVRLHDGKGNFLSGFTKQKFDCSSLVQYVFYKGANKYLQVTTRTQVKQGQYVPRAQLQRGDCIYFTNETRQHLTGIERVGHVAIYLGDNYILHTASDYARIEKMSSTRWGFYIEARRFV